MSSASSPNAPACQWVAPMTRRRPRPCAARAWRAGPARPPGCAPGRARRDRRTTPGRSDLAFGLAVVGGPHLGGHQRASRRPSSARPSTPRPGRTWARSRTGSRRLDGPRHAVPRVGLGVGPADVERLPRPDAHGGDGRGRSCPERGVPSRRRFPGWGAGRPGMGGTGGVGETGAVSEPARTNGRPTDWPTRPAPTSSSTPTTRWTGTRGDPRPSSAPGPRTARSCCRSATRPATGATSWSASRSRTPRRPRS